MTANDVRAQLVTVALYCVFIAAILPYLVVQYAKFSAAYIKEGNRAPRLYGEGLTGPKQRAYWAHQNGFEAFPAFAAVVIIATIVGRGGGAIDALAVAFIVARVLYSFFYILDRPNLRSGAWFIGVSCVLAMMGVIIV